MCKLGKKHKVLETIALQDIQNSRSQNSNNSKSQYTRINFLLRRHNRNLGKEAFPVEIIDQRTLGGDLDTANEDLKLVWDAFPE